MVAQTPINIIFCKSVTRTFRRIYVDTLNRLKFLAEVSKILQKTQFFGQFEDHNLGKKHAS